MAMWGKLIGGAAGFAMGGPFGAFVGGATGHVFDMLGARRGRESGERQRGGDGLAALAATKGTSFTIAIIVLGAKMAKVDGRVTEEEITAFQQAFQVSEGEIAHVAAVFDRAKHDALGFEFYARQLREILADDRDMLERVLDGLFHIAKADAIVNKAELNYLFSVATLFGLSEDDFAHVRASHLGVDRLDPYHVLGVERGSTPASIKSAYRKLVREYHPDRLIAKGLPEESIRTASERLAAINGAYAQIAAERGL